MRRFAQFELAARYYALEFHQGHVNERRLAPTTLDRKRPEVDKTKKLPEDTMPGDSTKTGDMENGLDKPRHTQATLLIGEGAEAGPRARGERLTPPWGEPCVRMPSHGRPLLAGNPDNSQLGRGLPISHYSGANNLLALNT